MRPTITLLLISLSAAGLAAQDTTTRPLKESASASSVAPYREPHRARILGTVIPGAGQFYAGEYLSGYLTFVATGTTLAMAPLLLSADGCTLGFLSECKWPFRAVGACLVGASLWKWFSTARDAPHAAERANARHRAKGATLAPLVEPSPTVPGRWNTGLTLRW
jgi:hypothetical protein